MPFVVFVILAVLAALVRLYGTSVREDPKDFDYVPVNDSRYVVPLRERSRYHPGAIPQMWERLWEFQNRLI